MYESSTQFGAEYAYGSVESIRDDGATKLVKTDMGEEFIGKAIIIGTGSEYKKLGVPGEEDFSGREFPTVRYVMVLSLRECT